MQIDFYSKYGYCEVPKGVILYRGHCGREIANEMFFGAKYYPVTSYGNGVQLWKTKRKIKLLFLVNVTLSKNYTFMCRKPSQ